MKRICKELMKKNNEREKEILECNDEIYTNMIVYLRCSDITEYNQELVREDLINMIIDGQNRGDDIKKVMGGNYKDICDEIIESMPKTTKLEKFLSALQIGLSSVWILGLIAVIKELLFNIIMGNGDWNFELDFDCSSCNSAAEHGIRISQGLDSDDIHIGVVDSDIGADAPCVSVCNRNRTKLYRVV